MQNHCVLVETQTPLVFPIFTLLAKVMATRKSTISVRDFVKKQKTLRYLKVLKPSFVRICIVLIVSK